MDSSDYDNIAQASAKLSEIQEEINALQTTLTRDAPQLNALELELYATDQRIAALALELEILNTTLEDQTQRLNTLEDNLDETQAQIDILQNTLQEHLKIRYSLGTQPGLKLLLNLDNPATLNRTLSYMDYLNQAYAVDIQALTESLTHLARLKQDLSLQNTQLNATRQTQDQQQQALTEQRAAQAEVYAELNATMNTNQEKLQQRLDDEQALAQIVATLQQAVQQGALNSVSLPAFLPYEGQLAWPTEGQIAHSFGQREANNAASAYQGIVIAAPEGQGVYAIHPGRVIYAQWLRGFGFLLIIEHGDGFMSLYGHNQRLAKVPGDWVESGELIAEVGKSGIIDQSGLYFEIRHDGKPQDPLIWLTQS